MTDLRTARFMADLGVGNVPGAPRPQAERRLPPRPGEPEFDLKAYEGEREAAALRRISERMNREKRGLVIQTRPKPGEESHGSGFSWLKSNRFSPHRWRK
jgi:hypothetical protein